MCQCVSSFVVVEPVCMGYVVCLFAYLCLRNILAYLVTYLQHRGNVVFCLCHITLFDLL